MEVCCTLGMIEKQQAEELKKAGLTAYNHNLDTSREYYPNIITTRSYDDRLQTLQHVREAGISICSGDSSKLLMFLAFIRGLRTTLHKAILFQLTKNWAIYVFGSSVYNMVLHLFFFQVESLVLVKQRRTGWGCCIHWPPCLHTLRVFLLMHWLL